MDAVSITPLRLAWLQKLAGGPAGLSELPIASNRTFQPLIDAGFISIGLGVFEITDTGRAVLAKASKGKQ